MKNYSKPSVKLLSKSCGEISYLLWLKSRAAILTNVDGSCLDVSDVTNVNQLPDKFQVGGEVVDRDTYAKRIHLMNLQYMNFTNYVFEIQGSCLFRDILFNLNRVAQWATSNRFLFSILDKDAVYDESNYAISEEYKDIQEWEDQFDVYMDAIRKDAIVDHNRLEMPYSISSKFWVSINHKLLLDVLRFLKFHAPFFYKHYGHQLAKEVGLPDSEIVDGDLSASILQYMRAKDNNLEFQESSDIQGDTCIVNSKMGLILYSQFIRQADTTISGLFDRIVHTSEEMFKKEVFKGNTILNVHYVAHRDKAFSTVSTRLCAFAMSSGDDPCSWAYFIKRFFDGQKIPPRDLMRILPCKFHGTKLINCKFHDDIKFRNEGKELSNCPCPLVSLSLVDAQRKAERDRNFIGDSFYDLTKYLLTQGLPYYWDADYWTSHLQIRANKDITKEMQKDIDERLQSISNFRNNPHFDCPYYIVPVEIFKAVNHGDDYTCIMKGIAIDCIKKYLGKHGVDSFLINFGGDIYGQNVPETMIDIEGSKLKIRAKRSFSVFTSGNNDKRGMHIQGGMPGCSSVTFVQWDDSVDLYSDNTLVDLISTKHFANELEATMELIRVLNKFNDAKRIFFIDLNEDGKIMNKVYCASPFFNEKQIEERDAMVSIFSEVFRPDLTESSKKYDAGEDNQVGAVVDDNVRGIKTSQLLVFPNRTDDLGTLFEVGYALGKSKPIVSYEKDSWILSWHVEDSLNPPSGATLFDCSSKSEVVSLGYQYACSSDASNIYYELRGKRDNIMLSNLFTHVENKQGKYVKIKRAITERDK